jgi:cyclopropane-fatty-acyl-phospholipid synthase
MHARLEPVHHDFMYRLSFFAFDLDELPAIDRRLSLFGYNRVRPFAIHDADYLDDGPGTIRDKLLSRLKSEGLDKPIERITLVTAARYFHYVFNPVSFYYCYNPANQLEYVVAEVNNTYRERHLYLLRDGPEPTRGFLKRFRSSKAFHVSPFNDMKGEYDFQFTDIGDTLDIRLDILREDRVVFRTRLWGDSKPLTNTALVRTALRHPVTTSLTMPRILWQAAKLRWGKKLEHRPKPPPSSPLTIRVAPPSRLQTWAMSEVFKTFRSFESGSLTVMLPDGPVHRFGREGTGVGATMRVNDYRLFRRVVLHGDNGFGDAYVDGDWMSDDPVAVLRVLADNMDVIENRRQTFSAITRVTDRIGHTLRRNTRWGSKRNIFAHYDIGNDFFQLFLDPTMTYSCALFAEPGDDLETAQMNKLRSLIDKARISPDDHVLEIGCGWGSFAIEAARRTGCRVTGVTISEAQRSVAVERVREAGLDDRVSIELCDYRDIEGSFDKIVSIEMLEAVGHEYFGKFFDACDRVLKPDGILAIQVITMPDERYQTYRFQSDWIQKRIFPGGMVASVGALRDAAKKHTAFAIDEAVDIGPHYARTLAVWRSRLKSKTRDLAAMGFDDRFCRTWEYYFSFCEAGFAAGLLGDHQIVFKRPRG